MTVRIRLARHGRTHRPFFRIVAIDKRCHREGTANEILGTYDPLLPDKNISVTMERVDAWVQKGAQISTPLVKLFKHFGYTVPVALTTSAKPEAKKRKTPKSDGKTWVTPTRRALKKHATVVKAKKKAEAEAAAAKKAAEAPAAETPAAKS